MLQLQEKFNVNLKDAIVCQIFVKLFVMHVINDFSEKQLLVVHAFCCKGSNEHFLSIQDKVTQHLSISLQSVTSKVTNLWLTGLISGFKFARPHFLFIASSTCLTKLLYFLTFGKWWACRSRQMRTAKSIPQSVNLTTNS